MYTLFRATTNTMTACVQRLHGRRVKSAQYTLYKPLPTPKAATSRLPSAWNQCPSGSLWSDKDLGERVSHLKGHSHVLLRVCVDAGANTDVCNICRVGRRLKLAACWATWRLWSRAPN